MDRMKLWLLPIYAIVGFIALLLALPDSRWVVCTQWDVLAGHWRGEVITNGASGTRLGSIEPVFPELDKAKISPDETAKFLTLADFPPASIDPKPILANLTELFEMCKAKNDLRYWAVFARTGSVFATLPRMGERTSFVIGSYAKLQSMVGFACEQGKKLDPENAFFPASYAATIYCSTDPKHPDPNIVQAARAEYIAASKLSRFNDYSNFEPEMAYRYLLGHTSPKGNFLRTWIYFERGGSPLSIYIFRKTFIAPEDIEGRVATIKLFTKIVRGTQSEYEAIFADGMIDEALRAGTKYDHPIKDVLLKASLDECVRLLQAKAGPDTSIADGGKLVLAVNDRMAKWGDTRVDVSGLINSDRPAVSAIALLAILLVPFAIFFAWMSSKFERLQIASPYLIWLVGFAADRAISGGNEVPLYFAFTGVLFIAALVPSMQKRIDQLGWLIAGFAYVAWMFSGTYLPFLMIFLPFSAALYIQRRVENPNVFITATGIVLACLTGATYWITLTAHYGAPMACAFGTLGVLGACGMIRVGNPISWYKVAGVSCLAFAAVYGWVVAREVSADRQLAIVNQTLGEHSNTLLGSP
jgi:hypothetical protein